MNKIKKLVLAATKGGTGKSTIATSIAACLACAGKDVLLLDSDKQGTSKRWVDRRNKYHPEVAKVHAAEAVTGEVVHTLNEQARRFEYVVCDVGCGQENESLSSSMLGADVVLVPVRNSISDLETAVCMNDLIKQVRRHNTNLLAYVMLNMAPTHTQLMHEGVAARDFLSKYDQFDVPNLSVSDRKIFRDVMMPGLSVCETSNSKARAEIQLLTQFIFKL